MLSNSTPPLDRGIPNKLSMIYGKDHGALRELINHIHAAAIDSSPRAIRRPRLQELVGNISRAQVCAMLDTKSPAYDSTFPRPFQLNSSPNSPKLWWETEVIAWLHSKANNRQHSNDVKA